MTPYAGPSNIYAQGDGVLQFIIAFMPLLIVFFMRMVLGRSKEMMLAGWLSLGWFALRASLNPSLVSLVRPLERLLG